MEQDKSSKQFQNRVEFTVSNADPKTNSTIVVIHTVLGHLKSIYKQEEIQKLKDDDYITLEFYC